MAHKEWHIDWDHRPGGSHQVVDDNGMTVCFMATPSDDEDVQLIASAPKMNRRLVKVESALAEQVCADVLLLEALLDAQEAVDHLVNNAAWSVEHECDVVYNYQQKDLNHYREMQAKVQAAIAKAKGQA